MMKTTYATMLLVIGLMALIFMLPSVYLNAEPIGNPASPVSIINQTDIKGLNQSESPLLMAQTTEEHRSSTTSSSSTAEAPPPVQENRSSESSSSSSMKTTTTEAPQAVVEHNCAGHCRDRYTESLGECNDPGHPHHRSCEKWARERESECLDKCSRE
ncbi:MAG: hypothetical protein ABSF90_28510 [Syntrophobacteraceae bacterium]